MKTYAHFNMIMMASLLLTFGCKEDGLFNKEIDNTPANIKILYPQANTVNYITSIGYADYMVFLLSDPEKNGKKLTVTGIGTVTLELNDNPIYYDDVPDTLFGLSPIIYANSDNLIQLYVEVEDKGDRNTLSDHTFSFTMVPDNAFITNPKLTRTEDLSVEFDVHTFSKDLGSIVSFNFTTVDVNAGAIYNFGQHEYYSAMNEINCNNCHTSQPTLTSHFSTHLIGKDIKSGNNLYVHIYVIDHKNSNGSHTNYRYPLGVIP